MKRLNNAGRFGYPVFVVLDEEGRILHIQDSGLLEEGEGYNQKKVLSFFKNWTPKAVRSLVSTHTPARISHAVCVVNRLISSDG